MYKIFQKQIFLQIVWLTNEKVKMILMAYLSKSNHTKKAFYALIIQPKPRMFWISLLQYVLSMSIFLKSRAPLWSLNLMRPDRSTFLPKYVRDAEWVLKARADHNYQWKTLIGHVMDSIIKLVLLKTFWALCLIGTLKNTLIISENL